MAAALLISDKQIFEDGAIVQIRIWSVPRPVPPSGHTFKYSAVYIVSGERIIGFDNERGKGDHYHLHGREHAYTFVSISQMLRDFTDMVAIERTRYAQGRV